MPTSTRTKAAAGSVPTQPALPSSQPVTAAAPDRRRRPESPAPWEGPTAALRLTAPFAPLFATIVAVIAYLLMSLPIDSSPKVPDTPVAALAIGMAAMLVLWALAVLLGITMTSAPSAQPRLYMELAHRYKNVRDRLAQLTAGTSAQPSVEARNSLLYSNRVLIGEENGPALRWALAYGYVGVLRALHRAEQEIMIFEPREDLLGDIQYDELALSRSSIDNRDVLLGSLASAKSALGPGAGSKGLPGISAARNRALEAEARQKAVTVRRAIDQFRDDCRDGIVRSRNQLLSLVLVLGWLTFAMFGLGVLTGAKPIYILSLAAFYLVGMGAALAGRMRIGARHTNSSEDFGLGQVRLTATLLMAGLAAVGGVYLVAALPQLVPAQGATINPVPDLTTIFDLRSNTAALLYATLFGLLPETLTNLLLGGADKLQDELASTRPANSDR